MAGHETIQQCGHCGAWCGHWINDGRISCNRCGSLRPWTAAPPHTTPPTQDCTSPIDTESTPPSPAGGGTPAPTSGGSAPLDGD